MKKLVMAAAVLGAFAGAAQAQTSVTLYGVADGDLRFDHTNLGTLKSVGSGGNNGSRWGLRGSEDLGGGLKANFLLEQGFDLSDNSVPQGNIGGGASAGVGGSSTAPHSSTGSRLFGRTATVGLAGSFGEFRFGRAYTPTEIVLLNADPLEQGTVAQSSQFFTGNTIRDDNAIYYDSPSFAGVKFAGSYQFGESTTNTQAPSATGQAKRGNDRYNGSLSYANGPVYVGVGYQTIKANLDNFRIRNAVVGASYDFGFVKLHGIYWRTRNGNPNTIAANGSTVALNEHTYAAAVSVPFGAWTFFGTYARLMDKSTSNVNAPLGSPKANFFSLAARYSLSKRTILYTAYGRINLKNGPCGNPYQGFFGITDASNSGLYTSSNLTGTAAACSIPGSAVATIAPSNVNPYSYQFGIRHSF